MQNSSIMLDSTIAEMLSSAKQVEPSMQIGSTMALTKDDSQTSSNSTEAEVRLVVKFIVEEHIVYKGKVKKVHQLESEELSRIVSRVAWDCAKENDNLDTDKDNDTRVEITPNAETADSEQQTSSTESKATLSEPTTTSNLPILDPNLSEGKNVNQVQEEMTRNNYTSNREAYINSIPDSEQDIQKAEEISAAQRGEKLQVVKSESTTNCDNNLERPSNQVCESENQCPPDLSVKKQIIAQDITESFVDIVMNNNSDYGLNSNPTPESIDDAYIDSQSVADTLNECVNTIDREYQKQRADELREKEAEIVTKSSARVDVNNECQISGNTSEHNYPSSIKKIDEDTANKQEIIVVETTISEENIQEQDQKLHPVLLEECSYEEVVRSVDTPSEANTPKPTNIPQKEHTSNPSAKRRASGENQNSSGKRIRRANPKERNSNSRTSASETSENSSTRHHTTSPKSNNIRVFAKWTDNHFYPGTILRPSKDRKFVIGFFDGAKRDVAETDLIPLSNIEGKQVRVSIAKNYCVNAKVHDQRSPVSDQPMFDVEYQQDGLVRKCVPFKDIFLTAEQGTPLINQVDKNSSAGNFADVDLNNVIYEKHRSKKRHQEMDKRSKKRLQEMEELLLTSSSPHRTKTSLLL